MRTFLSYISLISHIYSISAGKRQRQYFDDRIDMLHNAGAFCRYISYRTRPLILNRFFKEICGKGGEAFCPLKV